MLDKMLKRIKIELVGDYRTHIPQVGFTDDNSWEVELLDKLESLLGPLECPIDKEEVRLDDAVFCPVCLSPYHQDCARLLASRKEKCWRCEKFDRFDILVS
jgi:hypothetical protein